MAPRPATKQILTNVRQGPEESDRDYINRVYKFILEGEPFGDEANVMGIVGGLRMNTKLWKLMNKGYSCSYAEFQHKAGNLISEDDCPRVGRAEQGVEVKKPAQKPQSSHKKPRG